MKNILIGIPTYNGAHMMANCIRSIKKWDDVPDGYKVDILLLDDGSSVLEKKEESIWCARHWNLPIIPHVDNMGISKSWNDLCQFGNYDVHVLLNDDILVSQNWLTSMVYFLDNNPQAGMVGWNQDFIKFTDSEVILEKDYPVRFYRDPRTKNEFEGKNWDLSDKPGCMMVATGSAFAFRRDTYEIADGFDERYFSMYEEMDFGTTLTELGYPSYMLHYQRLYHILSATFAANPHLDGTRQIIESREKYVEKWGGRPRIY